MPSLSMQGQDKVCDEWYKLAAAERASKQLLMAEQQRTDIARDIMSL
jgi:hypothetical protein